MNSIKDRQREEEGKAGKEWLGKRSDRKEKKVKCLKITNWGFEYPRRNENDEEKCYREFVRKFPVIGGWQWIER
jgi:hypothetical protein